MTSALLLTLSFTFIAIFIAGGFLLSWAVSNLERVEQDMRRSVDR